MAALPPNGEILPLDALSKSPVIGYSNAIKISESIFTAIDFESAGTAKGRTDAPVQIGLGSWTLELDIHEPIVSFLQCDQDITWSARKVHGITTDDLLEAPSLLSLWPTLKKQLGRGPIVAHGHGTEKRFLRAFPGHRFGPWIDTLQLARAAWPDQPSHSLGDLCTSLGLHGFSDHAPDRNWHDALYDALASLALLKHLVSEFNLADQPVAVLLKPDTTTWHRLRHS
ncbi:MAG: 3'-5' exonuclease [Akkermansiaceae bacterium]|jgi:DNA polymerase III subunit epsilon